ncbi:MAG TPA: hypothetical protein VGX23_38220 [Actinocrinis sp.]|nr:hypothetical protein [Actinocrinis sp.]
MPLTATLAPSSAPLAADADAGEIPPDLASFLGDAPTHPALLRPRPARPHAAALTEAALALAAVARIDAGAAVLTGPLHLPADSRGTVHRIGRCGVLHLPAAPVIRAVSLGYGRLAQRGSSFPALRPGAVRLIPAGREVLLAELDGLAALAVEIAL